MECTQTQTTQNINPIYLSRHENEYTTEGCMRLAAAILEETCKDYVKALKKIKKYMGLKNPTIQDRNALLSALKEKMECERFYKSKRFQVFTLGRCGLTPDEVMKEIRLRHGFEE